MATGSFHVDSICVGETRRGLHIGCTPVRENIRRFNENFVSKKDEKSTRVSRPTVKSLNPNVDFPQLSTMYSEYWSTPVRYNCSTPLSSLAYQAQIYLLGRNVKVSMTPPHENATKFIFRVRPVLNGQKFVACYI